MAPNNKYKVVRAVLSYLPITLSSRNKTKIPQKLGFNGFWVIIVTLTQNIPSPLCTYKLGKGLMECMKIHLKVSDSSWKKTKKRTNKCLLKDQRVGENSNIKTIFSQYKIK